MTKIIKFLFSRLLIVGIILFIEALILIFILWNLSSHFVYIYGLFKLLSIVLVVYIINKDENPAFKIPWIIILMIFTVLGGVFYILFGTSKITKREKARIKAATTRAKDLYENDSGILREIAKENKYAATQSYYIRHLTKLPIYKNTTANYYGFGEKLFEQMMIELKKAKHFIFLEYFIVEEGVMWDSMLEVLKEKVKEGLDVRVMYDDCGSLSTLPYKYFEKLESYGIKALVFNPYRPLLSTALQNRDHRKIGVIDGYVAFNGGINLADEYINVKKLYGTWKDCGVIIKGDAVKSFTLMFLQSWNFYRNTDESYDKYMPDVHLKEKFDSDGYFQPYEDYSSNTATVAEGCYMNILNMSTDYVYINTPYFIIDNELVTAFKMCARRGVDVRVVTPGVSDAWYVELVNQSYFQELIEAGVKIYEYTPGFIHSKTFVADDDVAIVGTINLDFRSLYHNAECATWMYKTKAVKQVKDDFVETLKVCREVTLEECKKVPIYKRIIRSILRILAPLM